MQPPARGGIDPLTAHRMHHHPPSRRSSADRASHPFRTLSAVLLIAVIGAGCATQPVPAPAPVDPVNTTLDRVFAHVKALPAHTAGAEESIPEPVVQGPIVTVSYQGDSAELLSKVAAARGLQFRMTGPRPFLPLPVHVDVVNATYEEFLANVGHQFGQRADLVLTNGGIEIRHRGHQFVPAPAVEASKP